MQIFRQNNLHFRNFAYKRAATSRNVTALCYSLFEAAEKVLSGSPKILIFGESMEKAIDFCFRTGGTAGSVVTTQIAIVRPMTPSVISSAYLPNARRRSSRWFCFV